MAEQIEIVPAILRKTYEDIAHDWEKIHATVPHVQIDITDGIFAGEGTVEDVERFKQLPMSDKVELHMMVHTPANYVDRIIDLNPARCVFHVESFEGTNSIDMVYEKLREETQTELALALNPQSPIEWLSEHMSLINYVMFLGYSPGWPNQPIDTTVYTKIAQFRELHPETPIAVDGHVTKETIEPYVAAGARILCANTSIFGEGEPTENYQQLVLLAEAALKSTTAE